MSKLTRYFIKDLHVPFWAFAIHDGHQVDPITEPYLEVSEENRLREEDPFTAVFAELPISQFVVGTSRFQLDINRKIEDAVYLRKDQAWGIHVWKDSLPENILAELYQDHKNIYNEIDELIQKSIADFGYFVVYDIHSYNAKRNDEFEQVDTEANPQINLGTAYIQEKWNPLVAELMNCISKDTLYGEPIDIRENIKFKGGYLAQYLNGKYGDKGCVISFEFRKDFMNEWTGTPNLERIVEIKQLLMNSLGTLKKHFNYDGR